MRKEDLRFGPEYQATVRGRLGMVWQDDTVELLNIAGDRIATVPMAALQQVKNPQTICAEHGTNPISVLAAKAGLTCTCPSLEAQP